ASVAPKGSTATSGVCSRRNAWLTSAKTHSRARWLVIFSPFIYWVIRYNPELKLGPPWGRHSCLSNPAGKNVCPTLPGLPAFLVWGRHSCLPNLDYRRRPSRMVPQVVRYSLAGLIAVLLIGGPIGYALYKKPQLRNFRVVRDGVLYRSGQMT